MKPIDFGNLPTIPFHLVMLAGMMGFAYAVSIGLSGLLEGVVYSLGIQLTLLEFRFWAFKWLGARSSLLQLFSIILSFFANLVFLLIFGVSKGSNFILGFFLAYFAFLGIFVLSAILTTRLARKNS